MQDYIVHMGPLGVPLLLCSVASLAVILERLAVFLRHRLPRKWAWDALMAAVRADDGEARRHALTHLPPLFAEGAAVVLDNADKDRAMREELASLWLDETLARLGRRLRFLHLIAVISPLLGLLGTIFGMILAFQDISTYNKPINPSVVADGLWQALLTTAFGLSVALPALFCAHVFQMRVARLGEALQGCLNRLNLAIAHVRVPSEREDEA